MEAKLTSKGQITIPKEIRRLLNLQSGDAVSFEVHESGVTINKSRRPLTIQERFENYDFNNSKEEIEKAMREIDTGNDVGEER
ncbi:AbrB/MazE/SpoVT family DNA-binding domain-containing protein [Lentibacillus juripiscarius]|uniref:AbrB/MazE/SpoVT family DNA-binding domain-containing protein n=1 Tax=Lentibacillus juripiscarius TaxID=257446 RepID=A0ABW5V5R5_9BACI